VARRRRQRRARTAALAVAASVVVAAAPAAVLGAARDDDHTVVDEPTTTTETPSTTSTTTATRSSTVSTTSSTTAPVPTAGSTPPVSVNLVLRPDGIGPFDFGAPQADVLAAVTAEVGEPRARYPFVGVSGCEPASEEVAWIGLILTFEGPDPDSLRLTAWSAGLGDNPQQPRNYRMEDGPNLGDPVAVWQLAYGSSFQIEPGGPGEFRTVTINLAGVTLQGSAGPEEPLTLSRLWRMTTDCVMGD